MTISRISLLTIGLIFVSFAAIGCGRGDLPELGDVEGVVTMDGKALENVMVQFHCDKGGRPGSGVTDKDGRYKLQYTADASGTKVGPSRVEVSTVWPEGEPPPGKKDPLAKYSAKSPLHFDVKPGKNTFDLPLESK
jgi:hypothetical protein